MLSFKNARDITMPWMHFFLYGPSGSGKTEAAATFPRPIFIVPQNEGSIMTLRGRDIPFYESTGLTGQIIDGTGGLLNIIDELEYAYRTNVDNFPFDTIVLESLTHYGDLAVEQIGGTKMDQQKWGQFAGHFRNVQKRLRAMQVHVVFTSLATTDKAEDGTLVGGPLIQGSTAEKLPAACDVVGYCEESGMGDKRRYRVYFRRYKHFAARFRAPADVRHRIPDYVENFNFQEIEDLLLGKQISATTSQQQEGENHVTPDYT